MDGDTADVLAWLGRIDPNVILTLLVACVVLWKLWPLLSKVVRVVNIILGLEARLAQIDEKLASIEPLQETVQNLAKEQQDRRVDDERRDARLDRLELAVFQHGPTS